MNIVLRVIRQHIVLTAVFLPWAAVNHMDLITSMNVSSKVRSLVHRDACDGSINGDSYDI
jgi:hypothetical protein